MKSNWVKPPPGGSTTHFQLPWPEEPGTAGLCSEACTGQVPSAEGALGLQNTGRGLWDRKTL
jgi:hypothetical protein